MRSKLAKQVEDYESETVAGENQMMNFNNLVFADTDFDHDLPRVGDAGFVGGLAVGQGLSNKSSCSRCGCGLGSLAMDVEKLI